MPNTFLKDEILCMSIYKCIKITLSRTKFKNTSCVAMKTIINIIDLNFTHI